MSTHLHLLFTIFYSLYIFLQLFLSLHLYWSQYDHARRPRKTRPVLSSLTPSKQALGHDSAPSLCRGEYDLFPTHYVSVPIGFEIVGGEGSRVEVGTAAPQSGINVGQGHPQLRLFLRCPYIPQSVKHGRRAPASSTSAWREAKHYARRVPQVLRSPRRKLRYLRNTPTFVGLRLSLSSVTAMSTE